MDTKESVKNNCVLKLTYKRHQNLFTRKTTAIFRTLLYEICLIIVWFLAKKHNTGHNLSLAGMIGSTGSSLPTHALK